MGNFLTIAEVAERLGVSVKTVRRWCQNGEIPYLKIVGTVRFSEERLLEWVEAREREALR